MPIVNLGGDAATIQIRGKSFIKKYNAVKARGTPQEAVCKSERNFCSNCGAMLWLWDESYPELIHPFSSAIDTALPSPPEGEAVGIMDAYKPSWVKWPTNIGKVFKEYPEESLAEWHKRTGMAV